MRLYYLTLLFSYNHYNHIEKLCDIGMANAGMATALDFSFQIAVIDQMGVVGMAHGETPTRRVLPIGYINGPPAKGKEEMANCRARSTNGYQPISVAPGLDRGKGENPLLEHNGMSPPSAFY
ncbi:hypothetical protein D3C77_288200 [compost metagenome]